jgi:hypothetical protein
MEAGNIEEILSIKEVQLHEVANGAEKLKEWGPLQMTMHSHEGVSGLWLKVGKTEWSVDSTMPTLEANENTFMFAMAGGRFYSVLLAASTPREEASTFREILIECTSFEHAGAMSKQHTDDLVEEVAQAVVDDEDMPVSLPHQAPGTTNPTAADRIVSGAAVVQDKLMASAGWASRKILERSQSYRENHPATENPVNISPAFAKRVKMARKAAEMSSNVANKVAGGIADISVKMADSIIRHLGPSNNYGEQLNNPEKRPHAAKEIAGAAVLAAVGIYDSMEQASRLVLNSGGQATSEFVGHKYGTAAGDVAKDAAHATVTTGMTVMTVQKIGVKKIARKIAKRTAKGLAKSYIMPGSAQSAKPQIEGPSASNARLGAPSAASGKPAPSASSAKPSTSAQAGGASTMEKLGIQSQKATPMQVGEPNLTEGSAPVEGTEGEVNYKSPFAN